jgi:hypothetical protein
MSFFNHFLQYYITQQCRKGSNIGKRLRLTNIHISLIIEITMKSRYKFKDKSKENYKEINIQIQRKERRNPNSNKGPPVAKGSSFFNGRRKTWRQSQ